jgi:hypothetical protein
MAGTRMEKGPTVTRAPELTKAKPRNAEAVFRTLPIDQVNKLIRKVSKDRRDLFRRLAN